MYNLKPLSVRRNKNTIKELTGRKYDAQEIHHKKSIAQFCWDIRWKLLSISTYNSLGSLKQDFSSENQEDLTRSSRATQDVNDDRIVNINGHRESELKIMINL